ncbi:MAG: hypothetical protein RLZZ609_851 [Cyanobacteriota bacterium]|jgi:hypothetical protein
MPTSNNKKRQELRNSFVNNAIPTEKDFADLINASLNLAEDGVLKLADQSLGLVRQKAAATPVLSFLEESATEATWQIQLQSAGKAGFALADQAKTTRLFLDQTTGNLGLGTSDPKAKLTISEQTGTLAGSNSASLLIDHENSGGASSIVFRSKVDRGNDFAFIQYQDKNPEIESREAGLLTIGIQDDSTDHLALMPSGNVGIATKTPTAKLHVAGAMRVDAGLTVQGALSASGNVGIGTTTPVQKLTVEGQWGASVPKDSQSNLDSAGQIAIKSSVPQLDFIDTDSNDLDWAIHVNEGRMCFVRSQKNEVTGYNEVTMILQRGGNVSIGADSNSHKLHVAGTMKVDSNLTVQGALSAAGYRHRVFNDVEFEFERDLIKPCQESIFEKKVFVYNGNSEHQILTIPPAGVKYIFVKLWGAGGGAGKPHHPEWGHAANGGGGGHTRGLFPVDPNDRLIVVVGRGGTTSNGLTESYGGGGTNGSAAITTFSGHGGGYCGIFRGNVVSQATALAIAGGGGGGGLSRMGKGNIGGAGGGPVGEAGYSPYPDRANNKYQLGGGGGSQLIGGSAAPKVNQANPSDSSAAFPGTELKGGKGAELDYGGGGGGGYFGGGGGGYLERNTMAGGGGGSGFIVSTGPISGTYTGHRRDPAFWWDPDRTQPAGTTYPSDATPHTSISIGYGGDPTLLNSASKQSGGHALAVIYLLKSLA